MTAKGEGLASKASAGETLDSDPADLDHFYRRYFLPLVRRATWKYHLEKEDARDVVQEAFVVALTKLDPNKNPRAWLIQVVDHLSANLQRKTLRRARLASKWSAAEVTISAARFGEQRDPYSGCGELGDQDD